MGAGINDKSSATSEAKRMISLWVMQVFILERGVETRLVAMIKASIINLTIIIAFIMFGKDIDSFWWLSS